MKNLITAALIVAISTQPLMAGSGSSAMKDEEEREEVKKENSSKSAWDSPNVKAAATGAAVIAGALMAYKMYNSSLSTEKDDESFSSSSHDSDAETDFYDSHHYGYRKTENIESFKSRLSPEVIIDLSIYADSWVRESARIDLHPVYNNNPRKHLRDQVFQHQQDYHLGKTSESKFYIITGTGKKCSGPNFTLQNNVEKWLQEDFIKKRIKQCWQPQEGIFAVILKKNIS